MLLSAVLAFGMTTAMTMMGGASWQAAMLAGLFPALKDLHSYATSLPDTNSEMTGVRIFLSALIAGTLAAVVATQAGSDIKMAACSGIVMVIKDIQASLAIPPDQPDPKPAQ